MRKPNTDRLTASHPGGPSVSRSQVRTAPSVVADSGESATSQKRSVGPTDLSGRRFSGAGLVLCDTLSERVRQIQCLPSRNVLPVPASD